MTNKEFDKALLEAVDDKDLSKVKELLAKGASPDIKIHDGRPLILVLLDEDGFSQERDDIASYLVRNGTKIDYKFDSGDTLLHKAVNLGMVDSIKALLETNIDKTKKNEAEESALFYANSTEVLELLIDNGVGKIDELNIEGYSLVHKYIDGYSDQLDYLSYLATNIDLDIQNTDGDTALTKTLEKSYFVESAENKANILLENDVNINLQNKEGSTALLLATDNGFSTTFIKKLLDLGAQIDLADNDGFKAIHYSARQNHETLRLLEESGADIHEQTTKSGYTTLHLAAHNNEIETVDFLLEKDIDVSTRNKDGKTALNFATNQGHKAIIEMLEEKGAPITSEQELKEIEEENKRRQAEEERNKLTAYDHLKEAIKKNNAEQIKIHYKEVLEDTTLTLDDYEIGDLILYRSDKDILSFAIEHGLDLSATDEDGFGFMHLAVFYDNPGAAQLLIDKGLDIHAKSNDDDSVYAMTKNSTVEMVNILLAAGLKIDKSNEPNMVAQSLYCRNPTMADYFLEQGYEFPKGLFKNEKYLKRVMQTQHTETLQYLLDKGLNIESTLSVYGDDVTLLHAAVIMESEIMTRFLIKCGANPNAKNSEGKPIYLTAFGQDNQEIIRHLYENGADVNDVYGEDIQLRSPLLEAFDKGNMEMAKLLIEKGADLSQETYLEKNAPLHLAASAGDLELIKLLVEKGADVNQLNMGRHAPLDLAIRYENKEAVEHLRQLEAQFPGREIYRGP